MLRLNSYDLIKLVNYIRTEVLAAPAFAEQKILSLLDPSLGKSSLPFIAGDAFLTPVLENDPLLFDLGDISEDDDDLQPTSVPRLMNDEVGGVELDHLKAVNQTLLLENQQLRDSVVQMSDVMRRMASSISSDATVLDNIDTRAAGTSSFRPSTDAYYFDSYSHRDIHETMLRDEVRTMAYRDLFYENKAMFEGKTVLDVGCGTGILCLFAARAGAARVIGIDNADIIEKAREIVKLNGYSHVITLIRGKVEDVALPPGISSVDVIVSEWMGYFLLYESMLPTVLCARDRWLSKDGVVFPDQAVMYACLVDGEPHQRDRVRFWRDVYGFDMSPLIDDHFSPDRREPKTTVCATRSLGAVVEVVPASSVVSDSARFLNLDISTVKNEQLDFDSAPVILTIQRDCVVAGVLVYFDTTFSAGCAKPIVLSTSPMSPTTHWQQSVFYFAEVTPLCRGDQIEVAVKASRNERNPREYDVAVRWRVRTLLKPLPAAQNPADWSVQEFTVR